MTAPALDPTRLTKLRKIGGDALVTALIDSFVAEAPARRAILAGEDVESTAQVAHTLVAGAGQLGATLLADGAREVEEAYRTKDLAAMRRLAPQLLTLYDDALAALQRFRETA
jgi:HPt (histidine-containing phosphotransfer) domain-containing protein